MYFIYVWLLSAPSIAGLLSFILYSEYTPAHLIDEFHRLVYSNHGYDISMIAIPEELTSSRELNHANAIFDYTFSVVYEHRLKSFSTSHGVLYFSNRFEVKEKWTFSLHPSPEVEASAVQKLLEELGWEDSHLISSESSHSQAVYKLLSNDPIPTISARVDQENYDLYIGRSVKSTGNWKVVAITDPLGASKVLTALKNMRIYKERCGLLITSKASWGKYETGTILLSEEKLEFSDSHGEYEFNAILRALWSLYLHIKNHSVPDMEYLRKKLEENTQEHTISKTFSIVNFTPGIKIVGNVTDKAFIHKPILFPGNVTEFNTTPPVINISANLGMINYDGSFSSANYITTQGLLPMVQIINQDPELLSNFALEIYETDCGAQKFLYSYNSECMKKHIDHLGAFYIESMYEEVLRGNAGIFKENEIEIPQMTILTDDWEFYDKHKYPHVFVTNPNRYYIYSILPYIINSFGWDQILLYFHENIEQDVYEVFTKNAEILGISIVNEMRFVPYSYDDGGFLEVNKEILKEAANSKCRIFVLMLELPHTPLFIQSLYDLGVESDETVFILRQHISYYIEMEEIYKFDKKKVMHMVDGSLTFSYDEYTGEYGQKLEEQIAELIYPQPTSYTCFQIDSLLLGVHTIDLMLKIGRNYEEPAEIDYFMRQMLFTGCSGAFSIDSTGNGRNEIYFTIENFYVVDDEWVEEKIGYYIRGITIPLVISRDIMWANSSKQVPTDMIEKPKCGIDQTDISYNHNSIMITLYGSVVCFALVSVSSFVVWFKRYRINTEQIEQVETKREIMFEDGVEIAIPFVEACQHVAIGPGESILHCLSYLMTIEIYLNFENNIFWRLFIGMLVISSIWIFCAVSVMFVFDRVYPRMLKNLTRCFGLTLIPMTSKICFIPVLWILTRIFECKEGTGEDASDAFLQHDCNLSCWRGAHLALSIFAFVVLTCYSFFSSIFGTVYDIAMDHVSIKTNPFFSFFKSLFSLLLLMLHFHLRERYPLAFSAVYFFIYVLWTVYVFKTQTFNYARLAMWQKLVVLGVCAHLFIQLVGEFLHYDFLVTVLTDFLIIIITAVAGFVIQYKLYIGCFYRKQGRNFKKLLRFAYTRKVNPKDLTEHQLDYRKNPRPEIVVE